MDIGKIKIQFNHQNTHTIVIFSEKHVPVSEYGQNSNSLIQGLI